MIKIIVLEMINALIQGTVFIADEFNLSQIETMKSLAPS